MSDFDYEGERKRCHHHIIDASEDRVMLSHDVVLPVMFEGRTAILRSKIFGCVVSYLRKGQTRLENYD